MNTEKHNLPRSVSCKLIDYIPVNKEIFRLNFSWETDVQTNQADLTSPEAQPRTTAPKAGQFFMIKPKRGSVFLGRPFSILGTYRESNTLSFLIALRGRGTRELADLKAGEEVELTGPLGNAWIDFLPAVLSPGQAQSVPGQPEKDSKTIALVAGGIGIAPLNALLCEETSYNFVLYAGFGKGFANIEEKDIFMGPAFRYAQEIIISTEDGTEGRKGLIPDFLEPDKYAAVCACGPEPMLKAVAAKSIAAGTPCFISAEQQMACGVGACRGCTIQTIHGNRRCCADGPIFPAEELYGEK